MPAKLAAPAKIPLIGSRVLTHVSTPAAAPTMKANTTITASQRARVEPLNFDPSLLGTPPANSDAGPGTGCTAALMRVGGVRRRKLWL